MGDLTTAGIISGAGAGLSKVADTALAGGIQSVLLNQREEQENKRLEKTQQFALEQAAQTEEFASAREKRGYAHAEGLLTKKGELERGLQQERIGADLVNKTQERASVEGIHAADRGSKERLANKELDMKSKYYQALSEYYGGRNTVTGGKSGISNDTKKSTEFMKDILSERIKGLHKMLELATADEKNEINEQIQQVMEEGRRVANLESSPVSAGSPVIKDRFAKPAVGASGGR